jgi:xanthine dehydrogenase YagS FAD-binding subunit
MRGFDYIEATDAAHAVHAAQAGGADYLAGGTTLLDLMKLDVMQPRRVIGLGAIAGSPKTIASDTEGLHLGAFATMAEAADHPVVLRDYPVIAQSLKLAASAQLRNMATLGGNVLQRTRCNYFRDPSWAHCNKRVPGSGCAALEGVNRKHAVLGTSDECIATYAGDFAQALMALDARVELLTPGGTRQMRFAQLHVLPGDTPEKETVLAPGDLITGFTIPPSPWTRRSLYLKVRDRESYEFALASAAVALDLQNGMVREARIALGGVATKPWRAHEAEKVLAGKMFSDALAHDAADAAFASAVTHGQNDYKPELGRRALRRALTQVVALEI